MKRNFFAIILITTMALAITACGTEETTASSQDIGDIEETQVVDIENSQDEGVAAQPETPIAKETEEERVRDLTKYEPDYSSDELSYNEINFYINGLKYTLGETTLQDLIDDGIEFTQSYDEISSMTAEYTTCEVTAILSSGAEVKLTTGSEYSITANEMPIVGIQFSDFDVLEDDELFFDFQTDLTRAEFKDKYGDPKDETEMNTGVYTLEYKEKTANSAAFGSSKYTAYVISFYAAGEESLQNVYLYVPF